ncbi:hypothetical protein JCM10296v2_003468 [Rhodotorula toruloides]
MLSNTHNLPRRTLACSTRRLFSSSSQSLSIASKLYPGLYYHEHPSQPSSYTLSYLPSPPPSLRFSPTTLGSLSPLSRPPSSFDAQPKADQGVPPILPRTLSENPDFLKLVHEVIKANVEGDLWLQTKAKSIGEDTHIHIADERSPADANRIGDPSDILGSVLVQSGKVVGSTYEPNHVAYRLVTEEGGLMRLPQGLQEKLVEACKRVRVIEEEAAREEQS